MDLHWTIAALTAALGVAGLAVWRDRRPPDLGRPWRMPWKAVMALALLVVLVMLGHLVTLLSGRPFGGRMGV